MSREISIFNVQHFSIHDGPGTRTTIFFKGCPLRCQWCSNPESQLSQAQLMLDDKPCRACGACVAACPSQALSLSDRGIRLERELCRACFSCAGICPSHALHVTGRQAGVEELLREAEQDVIFYRRSGGGVTLGGGEPLLQAEAAAELLQACHSHNISTCMETCCYADWQKLELVLPHLDHIFCDIKLVDATRHRQYTGVDNSLILSNISRLLQRRVSLTLRYPLLPSVNDSDSDLTELAQWLLEQGAAGRTTPLELLPYHRFGSGKYAMLGRDYQLEQLRAPDAEQVAKAARLLRGLGINCINQK